jgi:histidinol-phosphate aminotransferase
MIFLCSPNNPTSNSYSREVMLKFIDMAPCMVVVDEAYIDFSKNKGVLSLVPEKGNLVVLQTLSKAWGLAGIRLGMVFTVPGLIRYLSSVKYPYNVNALTMQEALKMLETGDQRRSWVDRILAERKRLSERLAAFRLVERVYPSDANFLLVKMTDPGKVYSFLVRKGIIVRDRSSVPLCEGCLRITVGTGEENSLLIRALSDYENSND